MVSGGVRPGIPQFLMLVDGVHQRQEKGIVRTFCGLGMRSLHTRHRDARRRQPTAIFRCCAAARAHMRLELAADSSPQM